METKKVISSNIENVEFGFFDDKTDAFVQISSNDDVEEFSSRVDALEKLVESVMMLAYSLKDEIHQDLSDIWSRLDNIEEK